MRKYILYFVLFALPFSALAQYKFTPTKEIACTAVKSQDRTGTCWSFATLSFLESELLRMGKTEYDLSEMFLVRTIYKDKAQNYILRQGKANFSQGSLSHDIIRAFRMSGTVPESAYSGRPKGTKHDHNRMEEDLKNLLDKALKDEEVRKIWRDSFQIILDGYIGGTPREFAHGDATHTAKSFGESLDINPDDYWSFTSYTHHPFYDEFILEIPDNYSNGSYHNIPVEELQVIVDNAIENGYTIAWDGDVTEKGFSAKEGIAVLPQKERKDLFKAPGEEKEVNQELRQTTFESYSTTDDHLMHLVGTAMDQDETKYYIIKNSWGQKGTYDGYIYMSEAYMQLKTVAIMVHNDAVPAEIMEKLVNN